MIPDVNKLIEVGGESGFFGVASIGERFQLQEFNLQEHFFLFGETVDFDLAKDIERLRQGFEVNIGILSVRENPVLQEEDFVNIGGVRFDFFENGGEVINSIKAGVVDGARIEFAKVVNTLVKQWGGLQTKALNIDLGDEFVMTVFSLFAIEQLSIYFDKLIEGVEPTDRVLDKLALVVEEIRYFG
jgi:hypothetical protein